ncbi:MAG: aminodeoxychorismate/anthranilate synthase component II, partial [Oscillospiraceae bacterium]
MILLIDNYDSFTYNLYQQIGSLCEDIKVVRNNEITLAEIEKLKPQAIVISPGAGFPKTAGISVDAVKKFSGIIPILGVCLGHQAIAEAFGGKIIHAKEPIHGKATAITLNASAAIFSEVNREITVGRYHSLVVDSICLPPCLNVIATDENGQIMAISHKTHKTFGVQFHPESVLTEVGEKIIANFLKIAEI